VRFQVAYWRVSDGKKKSGVGGSCAVDGRKTHTKMKHPVIPYVRSCLVMTDSGNTQNIPTSHETIKTTTRTTDITSCDS